MVFTILMGFVVGVYFEGAQKTIADVLGRIGVTVSAERQRLVALIVCLAAMSIVLRFLAVGPYPVVLLLGCLVALVRKPLLARFTTK